MDDAERAGKLVAVEDVVERFETAAVELRRGTEVLRRDVEGRCCARCKGPNPKLDAGSRVVLPCAADGYIIRSAPMPGNHEDHEAFIGLAAGERLAFEGLTGRAGGSPEEQSAPASPPPRPSPRSRSSTRHASP